MTLFNKPSCKTKVSLMSNSKQRIDKSGRFRCKPHICFHEMDITSPFTSFDEALLRRRKLGEVLFEFDIFI